eukprot:7463064-Pyramimonas_sp.AAC.1
MPKGVSRIGGGRGRKTGLSPPGPRRVGVRILRGLRLRLSRREVARSAQGPATLPPLTSLNLWRSRP